MIAASKTAKTNTSFQEIFFNDLFPFKVTVLIRRRRMARYHHTKAPENLLNVAVVNPAGGKPFRAWTRVGCIAGTVKRLRHLTKLYGAAVVKPLVFKLGVIFYPAGFELPVEPGSIRCRGQLLRGPYRQFLLLMLIHPFP